MPSGGGNGWPRSVPQQFVTAPATAGSAHGRPPEVPNLPNGGPRCLSSNALPVSPTDACAQPFVLSKSCVTNDAICPTKNERTPQKPCFVLPPESVACT